MCYVQYLNKCSITCAFKATKPAPRPRPLGIFNNSWESRLSVFSSVQVFFPQNFFVCDRADLLDHFHSIPQIVMPCSACFRSNFYSNQSDTELGTPS